MKCRLFNGEARYRTKFSFPTTKLSLSGELLSIQDNYYSFLPSTNCTIAALKGLRELRDNQLSNVHQKLKAL